MQCRRPLKASFDSQGILTFKASQAERGLVPFELPCGKCLACHLNRAREKGVRAWHESKYHDESMFLTLTYDEKSLPGPYLVPRDHQLFIKRLRESLDRPIGVMVTGEYGTKNKRPHWHYLIFGYRPRDLRKSRETDFGDAYESDSISALWEQKGRIEVGAVTLESASYVARYGAKALGETDPLFKPFHRTGSKRALGKSWIEENFRHAMENGFVVLPEGVPGKIPRYYVDWCKQNVPELWRRYVTEVRPVVERKAAAKARKEELEFFSELINYKSAYGTYPLRRRAIEYNVLKLRFKDLAKNWSL